MAAISKSAADRLGDRIRDQGLSEETLIQLDKYRLQFGAAYDIVVGRLRELGFEPTGRPAKSSRAIVDKLRRESIRLSQVQDIAGCRIVVADISQQEATCERLVVAFTDSHVVDRREHASHGYRAVHVVVTEAGLRVEIQVRTVHQQRWAELSEKLADRFGLEVKYGSGPQIAIDVLQNFSAWIAAFEGLEKSTREFEALTVALEELGPLSEGDTADLSEGRMSLEQRRRELNAQLDNWIARLK